VQPRVGAAATAADRAGPLSAQPLATTETTAPVTATAISTSVTVLPVAANVSANRKPMSENVVAQTKVPATLNGTNRRKG
jgi:hypothetical protein